MYCYEMSLTAAIDLSSVRTSAFYFRIYLLRNIPKTSWPVSTDGLKPQTWQAEESKQLIVFHFKLERARAVLNLIKFSLLAIITKKRSRENLNSLEYKTNRNPS